MPDREAIDYAWRLLLSAMLRLKRGEWISAEPLLREVAETAGTGHDSDILRVGARVLDRLGWLYRRQDRPDQAYRVHLAAYHIRDRHGSHEELWETATDLGIDADLARRYAVAQAWHRAAIEAGTRAAEQPTAKQAMAWTNLSSSLTKGGLHDQAVEAARTARSRWLEHDIADVSAARADMNLGCALLRLGEFLHDRDVDKCQVALDEASEWLTLSREALLAFGPQHAADTRWCEEQIDFAKRLRATLVR